MFPIHNNLASSIRNSMIAISGVARANGGLIKQISGSITAETPRLEKELDKSVVVVGQGAYELGIDPCESVTFALSWDNLADELSLVLVTPTGVIITRDLHPDNVEVISSPNHPYLGLRVNQPIAGTWHISVGPVKNLADKIAYFELFVFGENHHLSGGIIATKRFYDPGDIIPLQFQCYYDMPITGLTVMGQFKRPDGSDGSPIEFRDDEKKDPRAGRPGNGLYSGMLSDTLTPGTYAITITADNSEGKATYTGPSNAASQIPSFQRDFLITLVIGEQPIRRVGAEPSNGYPGSKLQTIVKGNLTHFKQSLTSLDFGAGIAVKDVQVKDDLTALVTLSVGRAATLGPRTITATTGKEIVKTEEGFQVVRRKWVWSEKLLIRLLLILIGLLIILLMIMIRLLLQ